MTSAIIETATQEEFTVYSVLSEPSLFNHMMTSMRLLFLPSPIIPVSTPTSTSAPTPTSTPALTPTSNPIVSQDSASASTVPPSTPSLPPQLPQLTLPPLPPQLTLPPLQTSSATDSYTIPLGTIMRAVVNINIDLESLPFTDPPLNSIYSLSQCHKLLESMTGISLSDSADYLMESFYYYYNIYDSYDIAGEANIQDSRRGVEKGGDRGGVLVDSFYHDIKNIIAIFERQEEEIVTCYYDEITWFVELAGGRTRLTSIFQADLGPGIPHWVAEQGLASNAVQSMILLRNILERDSTLQQDAYHLELVNDEDL